MTVQCSGFSFAEPLFLPVIFIFVPQMEAAHSFETSINALRLLRRNCDYVTVSTTSQSAGSRLERSILCSTLIFQMSF